MDSSSQLDNDNKSRQMEPENKQRAVICFFNANINESKMFR